MKTRFRFCWAKCGAASTVHSDHGGAILQIPYGGLLRKVQSLAQDCSSKGSAAVIEKVAI